MKITVSVASLNPMTGWPGATVMGHLLLLMKKNFCTITLCYEGSRCSGRFVIGHSTSVVDSQ